MGLIMVQLAHKGKELGSSFLSFLMSILEHNSVASILISPSLAHL